MSVKEKLIAMKDKILNLLYPEGMKCIFCDNEVAGDQICDECYKHDFWNDGNRCQICDCKIKEGNIICNHCISQKRHFLKCSCPFVYVEPVRQSILKFKSDGAKYLAKDFAKFIYERLQVEEIEFDVIVPVPSHKKTIKARRYNPAKVLAEEIAKLAGKPVCDILCKNILTQNQKALGFQERQSNLAGSITISDKSKIKGKKVLLVDDVVTTCATVNTCAKLMDNANCVYVCAIARTNF